MKKVSQIQNTTEVSQIQNATEASKETKEIYTPVGKDEKVESSYDVLAETLGDSEPSLNKRTPTEYSLPKPVYLAKSSVEFYLTYSLENDVNERYDFAVDETIVEYQPELIGIERWYTYYGVKCTYKYFGDYVPVGIPTERYKWFRAEAAKITGLEIDNNTLIQNDGYTWISAQIKKEKPIDCCIYSRKKDGLVSVGSLCDNALVLKSNLVGVGHFSRVGVMKTWDNKNVLGFFLNKFQLKNKTQKSSKLELVSRVEPPEDIMAQLTMSNKT